MALPGAFAKGANKDRLKLIARDVRSLEDHVTFLSNKITFLLDATLGLISVEQNEVIRVLTVATTFFFPPTLIGTIYGMNFDDMPELDWPCGYPVALLLMVASAVAAVHLFQAPRLALRAGASAARRPIGGGGVGERPRCRSGRSTEDVIASDPADDGSSLG